MATGMIPAATAKSTIVLPGNTAGMWPPRALYELVSACLSPGKKPSPWKPFVPRRSASVKDQCPAKAIAIESGIAPRGRLKTPRGAYKAGRLRAGRAQLQTSRGARVLPTA